MKKRHFIPVIFILFASCSGNEKGSSSTPPVDTAKNQISMSDLAYPVKHVDWEIGDFNNVKKIVGMYKAWDENKSYVNLDNFADTMRLHIPEINKEIVVPNNEINKRLKENRATYNSALNDILSAVALRDKATGEDWVMVTTYSKWVEEDGTRDSVLYHDDWRLANGKVDLLLSFYKVPPKGFKKATGKK